uniref:Sodium/hydrogen exchanger n=1 Tax=Gongylonema pulchrum TaxID=637853 RepID=A0A183EIL7_9BILA
LVIVAATLLVHVLIISKLYFIPESLAIVILGALVGLVLSYSKSDWTQVETFSPNIFFLVLLPPIIFESGYNLHKGDFFANMFPILSFAIIGTVISALTIGSALYILGQADLIYKITAAESFTFGSMISAVDPVATLAIFQALNVERMLYMLVFGESMLNDAVAIVLTSTAVEMSQQSTLDSSSDNMLFPAISRFTFVFLVSAVLGAFVGFLSALLFKHVDLRKTPALELALLLIFAYLPYGLAEAISLSGIMAILFCSITMSQYTHFNISPITQITMQQTFRTIAFVAETCTFAYLGLALFTFKLEFRPMFIVWSILLCFIGRALNVFPLAFVANNCRRSQISFKNQFIMWYSGMRGAVAFALALHISIENEETKRVLLTTTLCIVLFTIIFLGGTTLPLLRVNFFVLLDALVEAFGDQPSSCFTPLPFLIFRRLKTLKAYICFWRCF